jgi:hypothetical protein
MRRMIYSRSIECAYRIWLFPIVALRISPTGKKIASFRASSIARLKLETFPLAEPSLGPYFSLHRVEK